jgi:hypothetical protein
MRLALIAAVPIAASIAALAASSPASAYQLSTQCNNFQTCYYANADFLPTSSILNMGRESHSNWVNIADTGHVCGGIITHTWNDCASSIKDRQTTVDMCNYQNADFVRPVLITIPGEQLPNLTQNNFNDAISSNRYVTNPNNC